MAGDLVYKSDKMFDNFSVLGRRNVVLACFAGYFGLYTAYKLLKAPAPPPAAN
eukprot:CAMPEP_0182917510 /NCGR_PEP_ID=MMETSP0105_2-20130417/1566_1 /TAXON_ID=81532 ORGANISM="Acanthoeca-like sp., Strain 10tr" /NCGR_SAMPLE_ID=MMETSP0105_2 /ASSEMBLY_ACC=CAM_ASM_000205 /LENGTH=52 /DNA_ID=CAMNT_0025054523 /DNA_START=104 /DNA_END=262 /DNA_ORIENTATION=+